MGLGAADGGTVVRAPDSPKAIDVINSLHDVDAGRIVCHPAPAQGPGRWILLDLLRALGKDGHAPGWPRTDSPTAVPELTALWAEAERVRDVIVYRADRISAEALEELRAVLPSSARLHLVHPARESQRERSETDLPTLLKWLRSREREKPLDDERAELIPDPSISEPWLTRTEALARLNPDSFWRFDSVLAASLVKGRRWLMGRRSIVQPELSAWLSIVLVGADGRLSVARLAGVQLAFLHHGLRLELVGYSSFKSKVKGGGGACRRAVSPSHAAAAALAEGGFSDEQIAAIDLSQVVQRGRKRVRVAGRHFSGAHGASISALLRQRLDETEEPADALVRHRRASSIFARADVAGLREWALSAADENSGPPLQMALARIRERFPNESCPRPRLSGSYEAPKLTSEAELVLNALRAPIGEFRTERASARNKRIAETLVERGVLIRRRAAVIPSAELAASCFMTGGRWGAD